jgi:hypothetical protein
MDMKIRALAWSRAANRHFASVVWSRSTPVLHATHCLSTRYRRSGLSMAALHCHASMDGSLVLCVLRVEQKINHFPSMYQICRKGDLARSLSRMARLFPDE